MIYKICLVCTGTVQGIGVSPTIYSMAVKHGIFGTMKNLREQAEIVVESSILKRR